jgi:drug/metabolite transporter (DMT)-like permease
MGVVSPIASLSVMIPLFYSIAKGERPSAMAVAGMAIAIVGAFCGSGPELRGGLSPKPIILAVLTAIFFGTAVLFLTIGAQSNVLLTTVSMRLPNALIMVLLALRFRTLGNFSSMSVGILIVCGAADYLANITLAQASTMGLVSAAVVLSSLYPVVTTLLAFKFSHERLHKIQYMGILLAIAGVSMISLG